MSNLIIAIEERSARAIRSVRLVEYGVGSTRFVLLQETDRAPFIKWIQSNTCSTRWFWRDAIRWYSAVLSTVVRRQNEPWFWIARCGGLPLVLHSAECNAETLILVQIHIHIGSTIPLGTLPPSARIADSTFRFAKPLATAFVFKRWIYFAFTSHSSGISTLDIIKIDCIFSSVISVSLYQQSIISVSIENKGHFFSSVPTRVIQIYTWKN